MTYSDLLDRATRILFFTGKGGVGKTSLACATALALAESGKRILLVSTDPASNLDEVLGVELSGQPTAVPGAAGLYALRLRAAGGRVQSLVQFWHLAGDGSVARVANPLVLPLRSVQRAYREEEIPVQ